MELAIAAERPPFVRFEARSEEDRQASITSGQAIFRDVNYALITPSGSKDVVVRVASEWLDHIAEQSRQGRFNRDWAKMFREFYAEWLETGTIPLNGTPLKTWPVATPGQKETLANIKILTVEDLAVANEEALRHMGMGGRELRERAKVWLRSIEDHGKVTAETASQKIEIEQLRKQLASANDRIEQLRMLIPEQNRPEPVAEPKEVAGGLLTTAAVEKGTDQALAKGKT